jgi:hypothetical protein
MSNRSARRPERWPERPQDQGLRFFLDRGLGAHTVPRALTHVLLCKDLAIAHNPLEAQAVYMTSARVFALSNASLSGMAMARWYADNEAGIVAAALRASGPYVMAVNAAYGLRRVRLAYPPE